MRHASIFCNPIMLALVAWLGVGSELSHADPYYMMANQAQAQAEAREKHLPLAWLSTDISDLSDGSPRPGGRADLAQMAIATLQGRAVIIIVNGNADMPQTPAIVHHQFSALDDTGLPPGVNYFQPKIVFSDPNATKTLGRVWATEMHTDRTIPIESAFQVIKNDPDAQASLQEAAPVDSGQPAAAGSSDATASGNLFDLYTFFNQYGIYLAVVAIGLIVTVVWYAISRASNAE